MRPVTQHEVAYMRFLSVEHDRVASGEAAAEASATWSTKPDEKAEMLDELEALLDEVEARSFLESAGEKAGVFISRQNKWLRQNGSRARQGVRDAAFWLTAALADRDWANGVGGWFGDQFNTLSNVYTKAMDGAHAEPLRAGSEYLLPNLARIFEGHGLADSWAKVREALDHDTFFQELTNWSAAYASDLSSSAGMPVATLSQESFAVISGMFGKVGISTEWVGDAITFNLEEILASAVPGLAVVLRWNASTTEEFRRMVGAMFPATLVSANPIMLLLLVVALAKGFAVSGKLDSTGAASVAEGGLLSGLVMATSAIIAGPVWVGMVGGILLAMFARKLGREVETAEVLGWIFDAVGRKSSTFAMFTARP